MNVNCLVDDEIDIIAMMYINEDCQFFSPIKNEYESVITETLI